MTEFEKNIVNFNQQLSLEAIRFSNCGKLQNQPAGEPDGIIIAGMGGSGLAGKILQTEVFNLDIPVPIIVWSDYNLPRHYFHNPLFIFVSFSGNTAETLSGFSITPPTALKAVVTTGGLLKEWSEREQLPLASFPAGTLQPRQATGLSFYALLGLLKNVFPNVKIINLQTFLNSEKNRSLGRELARKLAKKMVMIYTTNNNSHFAYNWKDRLNETGKALSFTNVIPEMCHNEIVSFETRPQNIVCLFFNDSLDHAENKKRFNIVSKLLKDREIESINIELSGNNLFEKIFQSISLADWTAFYLATENNVDPADIKIIEELKKLIA